MLMIQIPGALLVIIFQGLLNHADITTVCCCFRSQVLFDFLIDNFSQWGPYLISGTQQMILVVMCIIFRQKTKEPPSEVERLLTVNEYSPSSDTNPPNEDSLGSFAANDELLPKEQ